MEVDFDKEIDAMLRKAQRDAPVLVGDFTSSRHLDTDEISAFAENAMPEKSRSLHMAHLADCDRCRKILSNLLVMNSEAAPAAAAPGVITIAERSPWYRRLFLFPNLAYVMGSLVLIFSAFLGYTIFQKSRSGETSISQATAPAETRGGPNYQNDLPLAESEISANTMSNSAANMNAAANTQASNSNALAFTKSGNEHGPAADAKGTENGFAVDGVDSPKDIAGAAAAAPPPAMQPAKNEARDRDEAAKEKKANSEAVDVTTTSDAAKTDAALSKPQQYQMQSPSQSGPMRNNDSQYNRQLENQDRRRAAAAKKSAREEEYAPGTRAVGGKTFERKQGVWYDVAYQSRPTINVRRGSAEFNKLDAGLRSIANSLSGTAVIVWGAKAYRIQ